MNIETTISELETILEPWKKTIGEDYPGYRNHVYRMLHFCFAMHPVAAQERSKLIIAAAFHDIELWSHDTADYLLPSEQVAEEFLAKQGLSDWQEEVSTIIDLHHKFLPIKNSAFPLAEIFRKADLVDVSMGWIKHGLDKTFISEVQNAFPNEGFHKTLLRFSLRQLKQHPFNPLPMMKW